MRRDSQIPKQTETEYNSSKNNLDKLKDTLIQKNMQLDLDLQKQRALKNELENKILVLE